ncbi:hypothetical protein PVK06_047644 [Gossypium arboreum]|uniref:RNase H type-1 domain-containing protein n=1 Tax=Gossypium arboreum TaxID=29729 RepID=A0ABR0MFS9_GOSAR|nr:hypothetical protein PVK06_047644 [Gossypium arboreum]
MFAWHIGHGLLPTNVKLSSIKFHVDPAYLRCRGGDEMFLHALRGCPKAQDVLIAGQAARRAIKVNVDASMKAHGTCLDIIARDSDGFVLSGKSFFANNVSNFERAELDALIEGFHLAQYFNFDKVIFERDCASIVNQFRNHKEDITILGHHIKEARKMLESFSFAYVK